MEPGRDSKSGYVMAYRMEPRAALRRVRPAALDDWERRFAASQARLSGAAADAEDEGNELKAAPSLEGIWRFGWARAVNYSGLVGWPASPWGLNQSDKSSGLSESSESFGAPGPTRLGAGGAGSGMGWLLQAVGSAPPPAATAASDSPRAGTRGAAGAASGSGWADVPESCELRAAAAAAAGRGPRDPVGGGLDDTGARHGNGSPAAGLGAAATAASLAAVAAADTERLDEEKDGLTLSWPPWWPSEEAEQNGSGI